MSKQIKILKLSSAEEAEICAEIMANLEPWVTLQVPLKYLFDNITDSIYEVYLAMAEDTVAGFIVIQLKGSLTGYVKYIVVRPEWRNKKIGSTLLQFAEDRIFAEKPNVFLCVSSFNDKARRLYERAGYEVIGEIKNYVNEGYSEILMRKTIGPMLGFKPKV